MPGRGIRGVSYYLSAVKCDRASDLCLKLLKIIIKAIVIDLTVLITGMVWAMLYMRQVIIRKPFKCYDKAIEINPTGPECWCNKGFALSKEGKYEEALQSFPKRDWFL